MSGRTETMTHLSKTLIPYGLIILILACNLSSHSHGYWPGDTWLWRSLYWLARLIMEGVLYYSIYQFICQHNSGCTQLSQRIVQHFIPGVILSSIPFTMAAAMLDIATGRPDTYAIMVELENTGAVGKALLNEWLEVLPRHFAFCGLLFLTHYLSQPESQNHQYTKGYLYLHRSAQQSSKRCHHTPLADKTSHSGELNDGMHTAVAFMRKLPRHQHSPPLRIQAQEHYISVTTQKGTELIQYRFGEAIKDLEHIKGRQVHRSYWVADNNVEGWQQQEQGIRLSLHLGSAIPVSRRFEQAVKSHYTELHTPKTTQE